MKSAPYRQTPAIHPKSVSDGVSHPNNTWERKHPGPFPDRDASLSLTNTEI